MGTKKLKQNKTPYYIFACVKCGRTLHVKTIQKTKKCLTCNRYHQVAKLPSNTEIVYGMNSAIDAVKQKQHALAIQETGHVPDLRTDNEFHIASHSVKQPDLQKKPSKHNEIDIDYEETFETLLKDLFLQFRKFPRYMIVMMAIEYHIPEHEISILLNRFVQKGSLVILRNDYYTLTVPM